MAVRPIAVGPGKVTASFLLTIPFNHFHDAIAIAITRPITNQPNQPRMSEKADGAIITPITIKDKISADRNVSVDAVAASRDISLLYVILRTLRGSPSRRGSTWLAPSDK